MKMPIEKNAAPCDVPREPPGTPSHPGTLPRMETRRDFLNAGLALSGATLLGGLLGRWPAGAEAAPVTLNSAQARMLGSGEQPLKVAVRNLVVEGGSRPGDRVVVKMTIDTSGGGNAAVPWSLYRNNTRLHADTRPGVSGGSSFEVSANWQATAGVHNFYGDVDPQNTLRENAGEQRNNASQTVSRTYADWPRWIEGAKRGLREALPLWVLGLKFSGIVINGPVAAGGSLEPTVDLKPALVARMREAGAPDEVAQGFAQAVSNAWTKWASSVRVPGLPLYPAFAAFPGPSAPPMPNVPFPMAAFTQNPISLEQPFLTAAITERVRDAASWPGGAEHIALFSLWMRDGFHAWLAVAKVMNLLGKGPVPTFAPPFVPVGPVVGGSNIAAPGVITDGFVWP